MRRLEMFARRVRRQQLERQHPEQSKRTRGPLEVIDLLGLRQRLVREWNCTVVLAAPRQTVGDQES